MRTLLVFVVAIGACFTVAAGRAQTPAVPLPGGGRGAGSGGGRGLPPATGTALLMGQVVDGETGRPVPDAIVSIGGAGVRGAGNGQGPGQLSAPRVMVDGQGRFVFRDLPAGTFSVTATKAGYFGGGSGQRSPAGPSRPVELGDGERVGDLTLRVWQYGVVAGTVLDESGAPVVRIGAQLFRRTGVDGRWRFVSVGSTMTDDRGAYRFGAVAPGTYAVSVRSIRGASEQALLPLLMSDEASFMKILPKLMERGEDRLLVDDTVHMYPPVFYPGAVSLADGSVITVSSGAERSGVDFRVKTAPARTVAGVVTGMPADTSVTLRLTSVDGDSAEEPVVITDLTFPNVRFVMTGVPPGQYILQAESRQSASAQMAASQAAGARGRGGPGMPLPAAPNTPTLWAAAPVTVAERSIPDLAVALRPGGRVVGRVEFDGTAERPASEQLTQISVTLVPAALTQTGFASIPPGRIEADGTFRTASVAAGRYVLRVASAGLGRAGGPGAGAGGRGAGAPTGIWRARAAMLGGRDMIDMPLEIDAADIDNVVITFTDQPLSSLSGTVRDARGAGDRDAVILLFPTDTRLWSDLSSSARRVKQARTTRDGTYAIPGLPAGDYFVLAGSEDLLIDWQAPNRLEALSRLATRVQLSGPAQVLDLKNGTR